VIIIPQRKNVAAAEL
jgi:hypothetical protein